MRCKMLRQAVTLLSAFVVFLVGTHCENGHDQKRHAVQNTIVGRFEQQEMMINNLQKMLLDKMTEMKKDVSDLDLKLNQQVKSLKAKLSGLTAKTAGFEKLVNSRLETLEGNDKTQSSKHTTLVREVNTLKSSVSRLTSSVNQMKNSQSSNIVQRITDGDNEIKQILSSAFGSNFVKKCPSGYMKNEYGCYKAVADKVTWNTALSKCRGYGGKLVSLETSDEMFALGKLMERYGVEHSWYRVGCMKKGEKWRWTEVNKDITYTHWFPTQPNGGGDCMLIRYQPGNKDHLRTGDYSCWGTERYICEA